ncbi:ROK family transcriptional regulator [Lacticaseibacillus hegangensis]|uniref:ROK family transcriptional regulator n=1 Tax=Lacticaseibacillus hegangensis TaxID=2486010 RepID=A0ABW4CZN6_9LACO|nr:ROK family transcriptional regulator [Lacticaseibacillus hegangensis]
MAESFNTNQINVVQYLYRHPAATRTDITQMLNITPATVSAVIAQLISLHLVVETGEEIARTTGSGRKQKIISLDPNYGCLIGVDFTLAGFAAYATDLTGHHIDHSYQPYEEIAGQSLNSNVANAINNLVSAHPERHFIGVGLSIPGHYDSENHTLISNNQMWQGFDLKIIAADISLPIVAENNVECMAMAQYLFDVESTPENFLFMHAGFGLYCAFLQSKGLHPKRNYYIGEIGHTVVDPEGFQCECGKRGCLQTYISETWLVKRARDLYQSSSITVLRSLVKSPDKINLDTILAAYRLGDSYITKMLQDGLHYLAIAVANLLMMSDADAIYLNSRLLQDPAFSDQVLATINNQLRFIPTKKNTSVEVVKYDNTRAARGACALAALAFVVQNPGYQAIALSASTNHH